MATLSKASSLMLMVLLVAVSLISVPTVLADVPTPSVPEFTVQVLSYAYDVPPVYTTDQYTGETVVTQEGYHVANNSIQIQVKNQPFSYYSSNGTAYHIYYGVRVKGHFGDKWVEHYGNYEAMTYAVDGTTYHEDGMFTGGLEQSDSQYTTLTISAADFPSDAQIDIQVRASVGHESHKIVNDNWHFMLFEIWARPEPAVLLDTTSPWSSTQTISLKDASVTISEPSTTETSPAQTPISTQNPAPSITPMQPVSETGFLARLDWEQVAIIVLCMAVGALTVGMVLLWRRKPRIVTEKENAN
jgi:hypothetical protein